MKIRSLGKETYLVLGRILFYTKYAFMLVFVILFYPSIKRKKEFGITNKYNSYNKFMTNYSLKKERLM